MSSPPDQSKLAYCKLDKSIKLIILYFNWFSRCNMCINEITIQQDMLPILMQN
jgi:hypothetical protein